MNDGQKVEMFWAKLSARNVVQCAEMSLNRTVRFILLEEGKYPILDKKISVLRAPCSVLPLDYETRWTRELWLKTNLLKWQN